MRGWEVVVAGGAGAVSTWLCLRELSTLPKVWRGESVTRLPVQTPYLRVRHRSQPVFAVMTVALSALIWLVLLGDVISGHLPAPLAAGAALCVLVMLVCLVLIVSVNAFARPRFLLPPPRRAERGSVAEWRDQRRRRRTGRPRTDHLVEVLDVRPLPTDADPYTPYFVAICSAEGCPWQSDVVGQEEPGAEQRVRRQAAEHSDHVAPDLRRPLG